MSKTLSFVIPAVNEEKTITKLLQKVVDLKLPGNFEKELIIVNDGSKDDTEGVVKNFIKSNSSENIKYLRNERNLGKTRTVRKGLLETKGDYVIIQDADLEYEPQDIVTMLQLALEEDLDVVYGDRFHGKNDLIYSSFYLGNKFVTFFSNVFTYFRIGKYIPDMEVCYKLMRGEIVRDIAPNISTMSSFGLEPEITARLSKYKKDGRKLKWGIVPIKYYPRTIKEGKKIRYTDGLKAMVEIVKYNLGK